MRKLHFVILSFLFINQAHAQAFEMVERSWNIFGSNMDSAKYLAETGYGMARKEGDLKTMGRALVYRAIYYDIEGKADSALFLFYKGIPVLETIHDTTGLITGYNNLGIFHFSQYQYPQAMFYYKKAYLIAIAYKDYESAAGSLVNMGVIESYEPNGGKALDYYKEAEKLYEGTKDSTVLFPVWSNAAKVYLDRGEYELAYAYNMKSVVFADDLKSLSDYITERTLMTNILTKMGRFSEAEKYGLEGLKVAETNHAPERKQYIYEALSNLYYQKGDYKKAFDYSVKYRELRDSLVNETRAGEISRMEVQNRIERTNNELNLMKLEAVKKRNVELEKNRYQSGFYAVLIGGGIGLVLLGVLVFLLIRIIRLEKTNARLAGERKAQAEALLEKEKLLMRESHHRIKNNLQLINSILDMQSRNIKDPQVKKAFMESRQRIQAVSFAHQRLQGNETIQSLDLKPFLTDIIQSILAATLLPEQAIVVKQQIDAVTTTTEKAIAIGLVVNELLTNSIKYAYDGPGEIEVQLLQKNQSLELIIADKGKGMSEEIKGTGFGHQLVKAMTRQLKAEYLLSLELGVRHIFIIPMN